MEKNKIVIPITDKTYLVYRVTNISKAVLFVRRLLEDTDLPFGDETEQAIIARTAPGCTVLADALQEMAVKIRALPKE